MIFIPDADSVNTSELENRSVEITLSVPSYGDGIVNNADIEILTEKNPVYLLDMVKTIQGKEFRSFDNIEKMSVSLEYDYVGFITNIVLNYADKSVYEIVELLEKIWTDMGTEYCICSDKLHDGRPHYRNAARDRLLLELSDSNGFPLKAETHVCPKEDNHNVGSIIFSPSNKGGPSFLEDHFKKKHEDRTNNFEDYTSSLIVRECLSKVYLRSGLPESNFKFGLVPTIPRMLAGRFDDGFAGVNKAELKKYSRDIITRFGEWYDGVDGIQLFWFNLDKNKKKIIDVENLNVRYSSAFAQIVEIRIKEVELLTPLSAVWTRDQYNGQKNNLVELFGEGFPNTNGTDDFAYLIENVPDSIYNDNKDVYNIDFATAFNGVMFGVGKIHGKQIFNHGEGNEWELFEPFYKFIKRKNITAKEFVMSFPKMTNSNGKSSPVIFPDGVPPKDTPTDFYKGTFGRALKDVWSSTTVDPKEIVEFYDIDHPAPLDGIYSYVPIPIGGTISYTKRKRIEDSDGNVTFETVDENVSNNDDTNFKILFNKDEYISDMTISGSRYFISNYMKIKVNITFKEDLVSFNDERLRIFIDDLTIPEKRTFEVINAL